MKLSNNRLILVFLIFIFLLFFIYKKWPDKSIKITYCDVGNGDSILIQQGFFQLLIDSGRDDRLLGCLGHVLPFWDQVIEVGIVSHFDDDHMGYFGEIMGIYRFKELYLFHPNKNTQTVKGFLEVLDKAKAVGLLVKQPVLGQSIVLPSGAKITFLEVNSLSAVENLTENDRSLGLLLETDQTSWLFTGDGEEEWERLLLKNNYLPQVDVLKVGHHGSKTSSRDEFLQQIMPKLAVMSVGKNSYGHPAEEIITKLNSFGSQILRTDEKGDITLTIDEEQIIFADFNQRP
ncbi:MAG: hypothetical protein IT416_00885 [Candidatus Pacebacteria bacterium]|nr:hypothetical protein [Candidatus Paceibacterota bacterium]